MRYGDLKEAAKDLARLTLNGSPRWRLLVMGCLLGLFCATGWGYFNYARADDTDGLKSDLTEIKVQLLVQSINEACKIGRAHV